MKAGDVAGYIDTSTGYVKICVNGRQYYAHRLAWVYMTGEWPDDEIDHDNGKRADNIFSNLKEATHSENCDNKAPSKNKWKGVSFYKGKWNAMISSRNRSIYLGRFDCPAAAFFAYCLAAEKIRGDHGRAGLRRTFAAMAEAGDRQRAQAA
jgi:hypothetical protein